jgi:hypothetical protein
MKNFIFVLVFLFSLSAFSKPEIDVTCAAICKDDGTKERSPSFAHQEGGRQNTFLRCHGGTTFEVYSIGGRLEVSLIPSNKSRYSSLTLSVNTESVISVVNSASNDTDTVFCGPGELVKYFPDFPPDNLTPDRPAKRKALLFHDL